MSNIEKLIKFLKNSPVAYNAIEEVKRELLENGFIEIAENATFVLEKGKKYFVTRNNSSLIAFKIGKNVTNHYGFNMICSHSDSPTFKLKPNFESIQDIYNKVNVEPYGGMLCSTWLDRPLGLAGRVVLKHNDGVIESRIVNIDENILLIPNQCIHFNRNANSGYAYNMAIDMQPFFSQSLEKGALTSFIAKKLNIDEKAIISHDLYLYNRQEGVIWGLNKEYFSAPRIDDLGCVFTSLEGFLRGNNDRNISILGIFDNEEVGSLTRQGADSNFLDVTLRRINDGLGFNQDDFVASLASSFNISADNGHAVHPNFVGETDPNNKIYMNKGIGIKFNASQSYTSDGLSASLFAEICNKANVPYQYFTNRSDKRGGSTLGNISNSHISVLSCDIGLAQLAMHSSYETAGVNDIDYAIRAFEKFYSTYFVFEDNKIYLK